MRAGKTAVSVGLVAVSLAGMAAPASAGLFERIFGSLRRAVEAPAQLPSTVHSFVDPNSRYEGNGPSELPVETGPNRAFCVRTCDGLYFPVQSTAGMSASESCRAQCPASRTALYAGGNIDTAVGTDGGRYADLPTALVYRKQLVNGCTCNGKTPFGLARLDAATDPTLRRGDIVATRDGLVAFTGARNAGAAFTPVEDYRGLSKAAREQLSAIKIMPTSKDASRSTSVTPAPVAANDSIRGAQLR